MPTLEQIKRELGPGYSVVARYFAGLGYEILTVTEGEWSSDIPFRDDDKALPLDLFYERVLKPALASISDSRNNREKAGNAVASKP